MTLESALAAALDALPEHIRIVAAVSGGADSVAMLHGLARERDRRRTPPAILVAHLDHGLRGEASRADADFVRDLARDLRIPGTVGRLRQGKRSEAISRRARYRFLARVARRRGASVVLTAHTLDDQAETVLDRMLRGTGIRGLRGILPSRVLLRDPPVRVVRPLLGVRREALRDWLRERDLDWREDPSNRDGSNRRSRIRGRLLPAIEDLRPGGLAALARLAARARDQWLLVEAEADRRAESGLQIREDGVRLSRQILAEAPAAIRWPLVERAFRAAGQRVRGLSEASIREALRIAINGPSGARFERPGRLAFRMDRSSLIPCPSPPRPRRP